MRSVAIRPSGTFSSQSVVIFYLLRNWERIKISMTKLGTLVKDNDCWSVEKIVTHVCRILKRGSWNSLDTDQPHEAGLLKLDSSKAKAKLGWLPRWKISQALRKTLDWHQEFLSGADMYDYSLEQILEFQTDKKGYESE